MAMPGHARVNGVVRSSLVKIRNPSQADRNMTFA